MKKKGFTLIELLAVIVILAIIALIATPIVMNVIENSRKGAAERSAENYVRAVETAVVEARMDNVTASGTYTIMEDGNLCQGAVSGTTCDGTKLTVEVSGNKPEAGGTVKIENGSVAADGDTAMTIGDYTVSYNEEGKLEASKGGDTENGIMYTLEYIQGQTEENIIKYDPVADAKCETAGEGTCYSWYVLEDGDNPNLIKGDGSHHDETAEPGFGTADAGEVALIMNQNIDTTLVPWCASDYDNVCNADGAKAHLESLTGNWEVEANLPTYAQIKAANDGNILGLSIWLYDYLDSTTNSVPDVGGYWTSTSNTSAFNYAWFVTSYGQIWYDSVDGDYFAGVRPVITISKDKL